MQVKVLTRQLNGVQKPAIICSSELSHAARTRNDKLGFVKKGFGSCNLKLPALLLIIKH